MLTSHSKRVTNPHQSRHLGHDHGYLSLKLFFLKYELTHRLSPLAGVTWQPILSWRALKRKDKKSWRDPFILSKSFLSLLVTYIWSPWPGLSIVSLWTLRALKQSGRNTVIHLSPAMKRNVKSHISLVD